MALNTHRALFRDVRVRRAVNYAIDRRALAKLGLGARPTIDPTDQYLHQGYPGSSDGTIYPRRADLATARALVHERGKTAVLYTCESSSCERQAEIIKAELAAIGVRVQIKYLNQSSALRTTRQGWRAL